MRRLAPPFSANLRYPIGPPPDAEAILAPDARSHAITALVELPGDLDAALTGLGPEQLNTPYREGGWTLRQLAHHVADSHINAYTRLRLALTEDWPVIKPYDEALWADLPDARTAPIDISLALLLPLHNRWATLLRSIDELMWQRGYTHPESGRTSIEAMTAMYGWHGRHHTAHVLALREREGW